jgi:O-antigen/teichoic acid export membrane protein
VSALRWLAALPLIQVLFYLPADALTGAGYQELRSSLQVGAAVLNVGLNLVLIPRYSFVGAALATLVALGSLAISLWIAVEVMARRANAGKEVPADASVGLAGLQ